MRTKKNISKIDGVSNRTRKNIEKQTKKVEENKQKEKNEEDKKRIMQEMGEFEDENFEKILNEKKEAIIEDLQKQLIVQNKFGRQFDDMINDYAYFIDLKERLQRDIEIRGIRYQAIGGNGFVTYKPNESCERLLKTNAQMLKILQDLDLKAPDEQEEGEGDDLL